MKKLICLALASTGIIGGIVALAGCGTDTPIVIDQSLMGDGTSNKTGLGGYWWTYFDRTGLSSVTPDTGKTTPKDPLATTLKPGFGGGNGLDDDGTGNKAYHITGAVAPAPKWTSTLGSDPVWQDLYVNTSYGSLCQGGLCGEVMYPSAGMGLGFKSGNEILGADAAKFTGVAFRMKVGAGHGLNATTGLANDVYISMPMDLTDVPDPSFTDKYGTLHDPASPPTALESGAANPDTTKNWPFCSFPNSLNATGTTVGGTNKTCFANLGAKVAPTPTTAWATYCMTWDAFKAPGWASGLSLAGITALTPARVIKMQIDAYKPTSAETAPATFDIWIDDVRLIDATTAATYCAGVAPIGAATSIAPP